MSCPLYWWNNHYACRKSGDDVSEDIYFKFCRNYDYGDCPIYKQQNPADSRCYLTTACIRAKGLQDDCAELTILRSFRDVYLMNTDTGSRDIGHYYQVAPEIVAVIEKRSDALSVWEQIYDGLIVPCVNMIIAGNNEAAYELYKNVAIHLENALLNKKI